MTRRTYAAALVDALAEEMQADPAISVVGSYVLGLGPARFEFERIRKGHADRVFDPPSAEAGLVMLGVGAALAGGRPFISLGTAAFSYVAFSAIVNEAANVHFQSGGLSRCPLVLHMLHGVRGGGAPQHSHSPQAQYWNAPGLEIVLPSTPRDAKGLLRTALRSPNPTLLLDHAKLLGVEGEVPDEPGFAIPFGQGEVKRPGRDVTLVGTSWTVGVALEAAEVLAREGIEAEVFDPRTLVPFDEAGLFASVERTGRVVVIDECVLNCSVASEISARIAQHRFGALKGPIVRIGRPAAPAPYSPPLEGAIIPSVAQVVDAARALVRQP
jgi:pyruvate/2-oxoglutarate/acetoin dehydrogenase E1 component